MKTPYTIFIFLFLFLNKNYFAQDNIDINAFDFLAGKWEADFTKFKYYEEWEKDDCGYSGFGYRIKDGKRFDGEKLLLQNIHGYISYIATVGKQQPILFALINNSENVYTFENKEHDFPQKIIYRLIDSNSIIVLVQGKMDGETVTDEYNLTRIIK